VTDAVGVVGAGVERVRRGVIKHDAGHADTPDRPFNYLENLRSRRSEKGIGKSYAPERYALVGTPKTRMAVSWIKKTQPLPLTSGPADIT
jgi:hypothetical protein